MVHALQHAQTALLVQPSSPRYLRSTHISYTDPSSIANPRRVYFPGARPRAFLRNNRLRTVVVGGSWELESFYEVTTFVAKGTG
ncbi:hypothetical protein M7M4_07240 [Corynebacterium pseudogenitalium]